MKHEDEGEEDFEWEEWNPSRISFFNHMIAGSAAGLAEHVSVFPIDTLKTHIQCERCGSMSPGQTWNCATRIVGREGIFRLWRGVSATFAGCLPGATDTIFTAIGKWIVRLRFYVAITYFSLCLLIKYYLS